MQFSQKQIDFIQKPFNHTLEVCEGTPRSGKTTAGVFRYARYLVETTDQNHLVGAYNQEQAFRLFMECDGYGLIHIFPNGELKSGRYGDHLEIQTSRGLKRIYYKGGGKKDSRNAITGLSFGSVALMEIDLLHMEFIQECFRRTMASSMRYHYSDCNPPSPNHPVIKEVFEVQDTDWWHWTIQDNPIISERRKEELYKILKKNPYLFKRDWLGLRVIPEGVIYSMFDPDKHIKTKLEGKPFEMFFSADGGNADATSCSCNIVTLKDDQYTLNRVGHYYHSGAETGNTKAMSEYAKEIRDFANYFINKYKGVMMTDFFVDPSCKSLREELRLVGIDTKPAMNNSKDIKGSSKGIEVGIERGQNLIDQGRLSLIENNVYGHYYFLKEIGLYCRDDNGKPVDKYNHSLDELRYSCNYFYKRYVL